MSLPSFDVTLLSNGSENKTIKLNELCKGKVGVIDLWHTKCVKCPAALDKFNKESEQFSDNDSVLFIACALSLGEGNIDEVSDLGPETWENITHIFIETENKDEAKATFGYSAVPYYVVFDRNGGIIKCGDSKAVDYVSEIKAALLVSNDENVSPSNNTTTDNTTLSVDNITIKTASLNIQAPAIEHVFKIDEDF